MASQEARVVPLNPQADPEAGLQGEENQNATKKGFSGSWVVYVIGAFALLSAVCICSAFFSFPSSCDIFSSCATITVLSVKKWHYAGWQKCDAILKNAKVNLITSEDIEDPTLKEALLNLGAESSSADLKMLNAFIKENDVDLITFGMEEGKIGPMLDLKKKGWPLAAPMTSQGLSSSEDFYKLEDKIQLQQTLEENGLGDYTIKSYDANTIVTCPDTPPASSPDPTPGRCSPAKDGPADLDFPLMVKPVQGVGGAYKKALYRKDWVVSKFEDSFHFVYSEDHGGYLKVRVIRDEYKTDDAVAHYKPERKRTTLDDPAEFPPGMKDAFESFLKKMHYRGIGCFDLKYKNSDFSKPRVMELNPRICGSMNNFEDYGSWFRTWARLYVAKD
uniref:ATP-grasp domain-containing protein n=1 Tax=Chromera velia CCMP2878 TaxID=1169474 RepID=A0A0G4GWA5_9ALVE|eukprot:Cvel_23665.t1-p1 / transcript=Cvel_23665.t1 / gene=Cvel_23665 / organism=Chromera_velia_CCMP2878 / gene_product=hypothetical protein / transcript_product=hypothetical protein / location=Cvel_scaffold2464:26305-27578(-) / protein_length=388 / sequence_SO=supercontig / SO=protein_coding / is_pseudo=false